MTRAIIALVGALGLAFVWRASELYKDSDVLAYRMVLLIGVGLLVGLGELLLRATRVARLNRALAGLPKKPSVHDVEKLPEPVRGFVEARLNGTPQNLGTAVFTTYLLGLLVMMGLLGTFMGLFETLSGAREALSASGDVAALREGLSAPMKGLSRAFGTSATGVACSALLGLAAVFLRRTEARFTATVTTLASGPLFPWTTAGRQLTALEALADNREALPRAAKALEDAAESVQRDITVGITNATGALAPLLDRAVTQAADGASKVVESWTRRLEEDAARRDAKDAARRAEFAASSQATLDRIAAAFDALSARLDERDGTRSKSFDEVVARVDLQGELATQRLTEHAERVAAFGKDEDARGRVRAEADAANDARLAQLGDKLGNIAASIDARAEVLVQTVETQLGASVERAASSLAPLLDRTVERASEAASQHVSRFTERLESEAAERRNEEADRLRVLEAAARATAERLETEREVRSNEAMARMRVLETSARESLGAAALELSTVPDAVRRFLIAEEARLRDRDKSEALRDARLEGLLTRIDDLAAALERRSLDHDDRALALEAKLDHERTQAAAMLVEKLSFHAATLGEGLEKTTALVKEAAQSVRSGGTELTAVAEMFTGAVDRYRDANERWLDTLPSLEGALEKKGGGEAIDLLGAYLDQTREVFDHSLAFQRELFAELRALRSAPRELPRAAVPRTVPPVRQSDSDKGPQ